ncbi:hypothetical protein [Streptomyces niveus]|uniref:hypothetical protein n=1 Tax=Streptomyces niveus TaxID=193462 RepID=UPI00366330BF
MPDDELTEPIEEGMTDPVPEQPGEAPVYVAPPAGEPPVDPDAGPRRGNEGGGGGG